jgi:hypothetical protein
MLTGACELFNYFGIRLVQEEARVTPLCLLFFFFFLPILANIGVWKNHLLAIINYDKRRLIGYRLILLIVCYINCFIFFPFMI